MTMTQCQQSPSRFVGACSDNEHATYQVLNYWGKPAQATMGKHLLLCDAHAKAYLNLHPFSNIELVAIEVAGAIPSLRGD